AESGARRLGLAERPHLERGTQRGEVGRRELGAADHDAGSADGGAIVHGERDAAIGGEGAQTAGDAGRCCSAGSSRTGWLGGARGLRIVRARERAQRDKERATAGRRHWMGPAWESVSGSATASGSGSERRPAAGRRTRP